MIDEKKLIEDITDVEVAWYLDGNYTTYDSTTIMEIIGKQPKVGEWIPCSEMLPSIDMSYPNEKDYLVYYEHGYCDVTSYSNINRFWHEHTTKPYWNCAQYCKVVAWMPLPEPYKE